MTSAECSVSAASLEIRLRLREDLQTSVHESGGVPYCQLEDPKTGSFFRLGMREWNLVRRLDGSRTLAEAGDAASEGADDLWETDDLIAIGRWLVSSQLAGQSENPLMPTRRKPSVRRSRPAWMNPAFIKIHLCNPDRALTAALPFVRMLLSPSAAMLWVVVCVAGLYRLFIDWELFTQPIDSILSPDNWLWLIVVWLSLKALHEFFHGIVCKRFGGDVPSCGIVLILFSPVAYVDVTSSWRFRSKWQRIFTAGAGMYAELFVAAVAVQIWPNLDAGVSSQICYNVITMAGISTLLFNGNCLMRFDGYYMLTDLLGIQNLYSSGQQFMRYLGRRYFMGIPCQQPLEGKRHGTLVKLYGVASFFWRLTFYAGIVLTAATMFRGVGILVSFSVLTGWLIAPSYRIAKHLIVGRGQEQPNRRRVALISGALVAVVGGLLMLPWPGGVVAYGVVDYDPFENVRARVPGFVQRIEVTPGQLVQPGQILAVLENEDRVLEKEKLIATIDVSFRRGQVARGNRDASMVNEESKIRQHLAKRHAKLTEDVESLTLRAPIAGHVIGRDLEHRRGQFLPPGDALMAIGDESAKAIVVCVPQQDVGFYTAQINETVRVRIKGRARPLQGARLERVNPQATRQLPHEGLGATSGGPLPVQPLSDSATMGQSGIQLVDPHFQALVRIPPEEARRLRAGEIAKVRIGSTGETIGQHVAKAFLNWMRQKLKSR